jgi:hypothetical protein
LAVESRKKAVMRWLAEYLAGEVTTANGYLHDLTTEDDEGKVYRGRTTFGEEVEPPFLSILEAPRPLDPNSGGDSKVERRSKWPLLLQGFATDDRLNPTDPAYDLAADVERAMAKLMEKDNEGYPKYPDVYQMGPWKIEVTLQEAIVRAPDPDISDTAFFYLPVFLDVVTDLRKPYTEG